MISEKQRQIMQEGSEGLLGVRRIEELGSEAGSYKKKVKKNCFVCGSLCNPTLDFSYYCVMGNICRACSADVNHKLKTPEGKEFQKAMLQRLNNLNKTPRKKKDEYESIEIPDEEI